MDTIFSSVNGLLIILVLVINDIISFGITKSVYLQSGIFNTKYWLIIPVILYGLQILIFYYGLHKTSMTILNITWNLISNILVTLIGIYYFGERINNLRIIAFGFAIVAIVLFSIESLQPFLIFKKII
jgi:multidrug transporter EmrE-like cation transporter